MIRLAVARLFLSFYVYVFIQMSSLDPNWALEQKRPFSLLYGKASTQTARWDLKKLVEQGYLMADGEDAFSLNFRVLG